MNQKNLFHTLSHEYYQFTASEKRVADYVLSNSAKAQTMSISELALCSGVAEATISRFCRRLGYHGFAAFKLAIATSTAASPPSNPLIAQVDSQDSIPSMAQKLAAASIEALQESQALINPAAIRAAADALLKADKVLCMGLGGSMLMAQEAAHLFSTTFTGYFPVTDSHMQAIYTAQLNAWDTILYFSYSGSTTDLIQVLQTAKERGTTVILVTRYPNSPGAALADIVLECGSRESPLQLGSIPARVAQLYLIDVLFAEVSRRDLEGCKQRRSLVADALSEKHV